MSSIVLSFVVAAVTSSASAAMSALASDAFAINITEPLPRYAGPEGCSDSYDLVRPELLTFNVQVACMQQVEFSVVIFSRATNLRIPGCRKFCQQPQGSPCAVRCNVSDLPDTSMYVIKASAMDLTADKSWTVCVNAKDTAQLSFVGKQPTDIWSADGGVQLRFEATGYPRPISYELSCDGSQASVSTSGGFNLAGLPNGTTRCIALAYTNRRLLQTEPLNVLIHVSPVKTFTGSSTLGMDSSRSSSSPGTAASTTKSLSTATSTFGIFGTAASTSGMNSAATMHSSDKSAFPMITFLPTSLSIPQAMPQPQNGGVTDDTALLAGVLVACTVAVLAAFVSFTLHKRRVKKKSQCSTNGGDAPAVSALQLPPSPGLGGVSAAINISAAPIINNNNTSVTIFNNTFALQREHIDQESESLGMDEPCSRHYDGPEYSRGTDDEVIEHKDSLCRAVFVLQSIESIPPTTPPTQLANEPVRADCRQTSQQHRVDMANGYRSGQDSDNQHASTAIGRLSELLDSSALAASFKENNKIAVTKSATEAAGDNDYDLQWVHTTDSFQQNPGQPLNIFLSEADVDSDADKRRKALKYPVLGVTRAWSGSALC